MARINIEEEWWSDSRRIDLILLLGKGTADGAFLLFCRRSQDHNGDSFDATSEFPIHWIEAMLKSGLAFGSPEDFSLVGAKKYHEWIKLRRNAAKAGGEKSKRSKDNNNIENSDKQTQAKRSKTKQTQANAANPNPLTLTLPLTLSHEHAKNQKIPKTQEINKIEEMEFQASGQKEKLFTKLGELFTKVPMDLKTHLYRIWVFYGKDEQLMLSEMKEICETAKNKDSPKKYATVAILRKVGIINDQ